MAREGRSAWARRHGWRQVSLAAAMVVLASCSTLAGPHPAATPTASAQTAPSGAPEGDPNANALGPNANTPASQWVLTWHNEFNGPVGRPANWIYLTGGGGWSHRSLMYYTAADVSTDGHGHLVLTANKGGSSYSCWYGPCRYTSARMQTQGTFAQVYGKFEARIKIPLGRGIWPAFWMEGPNGEIDIIETNSRKVNVVHGAAHAPGLHYPVTLTWNQPVSASYHIFGVTWTRKGVTWTIDGRAYGHLAAYPGWTLNTPFFLILDIAVGGGWPGSPDATTQFPAHLSVDWIRVYREAH